MVLRSVRSRTSTGRLEPTCLTHVTEGRGVPIRRTGETVRRMGEGNQRPNRAKWACAHPLVSGRVVPERDLLGRLLLSHGWARSRSCSMPPDAAEASTCTSGAVE